MLETLIKLERGSRIVVALNAGIGHVCPCKTGVLVRYCVKCNSAFDDPTEWEADNHQAEHGHWVPWCLFCEFCEEMVFEGFDMEGPFYFFVLNLKEGLRVLAEGGDLRKLGLYTLRQRD